MYQHIHFFYAFFLAQALKFIALYLHQYIQQKGQIFLDGGVNGVCIDAEIVVGYEVTLFHDLLPRNGRVFGQ